MKCSQKNPCSQDKNKRNSTNFNEVIEKPIIYELSKIGWLIRLISILKEKIMKVKVCLPLMRRSFLTFSKK